MQLCLIIQQRHNVMQACKKEKKKRKVIIKIVGNKSLMKLVSSHFIVGWDNIREDISVMSKELRYLVRFLFQGIDVFALKDQGVAEVQAIRFAHPPRM